MFRIKKVVEITAHLKWGNKFWKLERQVVLFPLLQLQQNL